MYCDGQVFGKSGAWDGYATVVIENGTLDGELHAYRSIGNRTVNECEYTAVILALEYAMTRREHVHIITDSLLIQGHLRDGYKCKVTLVPYRDKVARLMRETEAVVEWMGRDFNLAGWSNERVLLERARDKRERERAQRPVRHRRQRSTKEQQVERRLMARAERYEDAAV